jgi:hypothetical protein
MSESESGISLVRGDLLFRIQRRIGLIPDEGLGVVRRAVFFSLLAWLPIAAWAAVTGRALSGGVEEPLLHHFGIHVRFLVAVPLLILGEALAHGLTTRLIPYFRTSALVRDEQQGAFREVIQGIIRLRNGTLPWVAIAAVILAWLVFEPRNLQDHELAWATVGQPTHPHTGFGGWWLVYVARPIFLALLAAWLWRLVLLFLLLKRIAGLGLALVPTHPDRAGGLGFLERLPAAFSAFAFAVSAVAASRWAHEVIYHGVHVRSLRVLVVVFLLIVVALCVAPLLVFVPCLAAAKRQTVFEYGKLVGDHGRLVHRRWILGESVADTPLLHAPEIGPVVDANSIYEAAAKMRLAPIGKLALLSIAVPAVIPMLILISIEIPIRELLLKILTAMV